MFWDDLISFRQANFVVLGVIN